MEEKDYIRLIDCIECEYVLKPGELYIRKGLIASLNGFDFRVYSNDHGMHFHIIHKSRGINARFSFPEIILIDYKKQGNSISKKEENNIQVFFRNTEYLTKLEDDFKKRLNDLGEHS